MMGGLAEVTPFIAGPVLGLGSLWLAYLAYQRGSRADANAQTNTANAAVYVGYGTLVESLQASNARLEERLETALTRLDAALNRIDNLEAEIAELKRNR